MNVFTQEQTVTVERRQIRVPDAMCEAYHYARPSAFSRGTEVFLPGVRMIVVSGTASVGPDGRSLHEGDFRAQARRSFENAAAVLRAGGATWADVVKVTIFIRDIAAHYAAFNEVRSAYFAEIGLDPYPASTCIEAVLCREELLVEMELTAFVADETPRLG